MSDLATLFATLSIASDAEKCGRPEVAKEIRAGIEVDCEWKRFNRRRRVERFWYDDGTDEDEDYETEPRNVQLQQCVARNRGIPWLTWSDPLELTSFDAILREYYSPDAVANMAMRPLASFANILKEPYPTNGDGDAIEARIGSYANVIRPGWYGVLSLGDDS